MHCLVSHCRLVLPRSPLRLLPTALPSLPPSPPPPPFSPSPPVSWRFCAVRHRDGGGRGGWVCGCGWVVEGRREGHTTHTKKIKHTHPSLPTREYTPPSNQSYPPPLVFSSITPTSLPLPLMHPSTRPPQPPPPTTHPPVASQRVDLVTTHENTKTTQQKKKELGFDPFYILNPSPIHHPTSPFSVVKRKRGLPRTPPPYQQRGLQGQSDTPVNLLVDRHP